MNKWILVLVILLSLLSCNNEFKELDTYISEIGFNGSVQLLKSNEIVYSKGIGYSDYDKRRFNKTDTRFPIGRLTDQFTAVAILFLENKGYLKLTDNISKYIQIDIHGEITIYDLLIHSSGLNQLNDVFRLYERIDSANLNSNLLTIDDLIPQIPKDLRFQPGSSFALHHMNSILLGYIIEKVSGVSYEEFLINEFFMPYNLQNTGIISSNLKSNNLATGYLRYKNDTFFINAPDINLINSKPAIGIYSTVEDLSKWYKAVDQEILSKESLNKMYTTQIQINNSILGYGFGWTIEANNQFVHNSGSIPGYNSIVARNLSNNDEVIILSNIENDQIITNLLLRCVEMLNG